MKLWGSLLLKRSNSVEECVATSPCQPMGAFVAVVLRLTARSWSERQLASRGTQVHGTAELVARNDAHLD